MTIINKPIKTTAPRIIIAINNFVENPLILLFFIYVSLAEFLLVLLEEIIALVIR